MTSRRPAAGRSPLVSTIGDLEERVQELEAGMVRVRELAFMMTNGKGVVSVRKIGAHILAITGHIDLDQSPQTPEPQE